jgi:hypothetical protein
MPWPGAATSPRDAERAQASQDRGARAAKVRGDPVGGQPMVHVHSAKPIGRDCDDGRSHLEAL